MVKVAGTHTVEYIAPQIVWLYATYYLPEPQKFIGLYTGIPQPWWNMPFAELRSPFTQVLPKEWLPWLHHMDGSTLMQRKLSTDNKCPAKLQGKWFQTVLKQLRKLFHLFDHCALSTPRCKTVYWFRSFYKNPSTNDAKCHFFFLSQPEVSPWNLSMFSAMTEWKATVNISIETFDCACLFWYELHSYTYSNMLIEKWRWSVSPTSPTLKRKHHMPSTLKELQTTRMHLET